jgi:ABC-type multidrug transport system fused ATPase/permease subunit
MAFSSTQYLFRVTKVQIAVGVAIKTAVFRKTLCLSTDSKREYGVGNISNLYTVDIERTVNTSVALHNFWGLPLQISLAMILLYQVVGNATFAGLTVILILLYINNVIAKRQKRANDKVMKLRDERMKQIGEMLSSMLTVKLNVWEHSFQKRILDIRTEELSYIWTVFRIQAVNICLLWMAPCIVSVVTISFYAQVLRQEVTAARVFTALSLFRLLQDPLRALPGYINQVYQALTSVERLEKFYAMAEKSGLHIPAWEMNDHTLSTHDTHFGGYNEVNGVFGVENGERMGKNGERVGESGESGESGNWREYSKETGDYGNPDDVGMVLSSTKNIIHDVQYNNAYSHIYTMRQQSTTNKDIGTILQMASAITSCNADASDSGWKSILDAHSLRGELYPVGTINAMACTHEWRKRLDSKVDVAPKSQKRSLCKSLCYPCNAIRSFWALHFNLFGRRGGSSSSYSAINTVDDGVESFEGTETRTRTSKVRNDSRSARYRSVDINMKKNFSSAEMLQSMSILSPPRPFSSSSSPSPVRSALRETQGYDISPFALQVCSLHDDDDDDDDDGDDDGDDGDDGDEGCENRHGNGNNDHCYRDNLARDIAFRIWPGQLVVVRGTVGSGKSSLLLAMLGEMYLQHEQSRYDTCEGYNGSAGRANASAFALTGSVAYASQQPWIQNMTLRDNILFGLPFAQTWYEEVVEATALITDFQELPDGDQTEIGEKGLNLSGGQKARVALARAVYANTDILLLDDILAALDTVVGRKVYEKCICNLLRNKTRVLVSHSDIAIKSQKVDMIVTMNTGSVRVHVAGGFKSSDSLIILDGRESAEATEATEATETRVSHDDCDALRSTFVLGKNPGFGSLGLSYATTQKLPDTSPHRITDSEQRQEGNIEKRVYFGYYNAFGGLKVALLLCCIQTIWQGLSVSSDVFLSSWSKQNDTQQKEYLDSNVGIYSALALSSGAIVLARTLTVAVSGYRAAKWMFEQMLGALTRAPMGWFDRNPSGRILNRLGDDQAKIDGQLPLSCGSVFAVGFNLIGDLLAVIVITRYLIIAVIPIAYLYVRVMLKYLRASREIQRMTSIAQSPVLTFLSETTAGTYIIRAFGHDAYMRFLQRNYDLLDKHSTMLFTANAASAWFELRIQLLGSSILLFICIMSCMGTEFMSPGLVGLCLSYGLSITGGLEKVVFALSNLENCMVAPERIQQYIDVMPEGTDEQKALYHDHDIASDRPETSPTTGEETTSKVDMHIQPNAGDAHIGSTTVYVNDIESAVYTSMLPRNAPRFETASQGGTVCKLYPSKGNVEFRDVWFRYQPGGEYVLRGMT